MAEASRATACLVTENGCLPCKMVLVMLTTLPGVRGLVTPSCSG